ncbi:MAG TPA: 3D domain-containing protein [bacterium]|jgi:3D (Asp-Asp-Asp) domain-containing protein|nr:3D domain-containing protein [bacterium]
MVKLKQKKSWAVYIGAGGLGLAALLGWIQYRKTTAPHFHVFLYQKDKSAEVLTARKTVGDVLEEQGIALKPQDVVVPELSSAVTEGMEIDLGLVERRVRDVKKKITALVHTDYTDTLNAGEIIDIEPGQDGEEELQIESYYLDGEEAFEKVLNSKVLTPAKDAKVLEGTSLRQKLYPLKKRARVRKIVTMEATAYYPGPEDTWPYASGTTASGLKAGYGVVAVDTRFIHLKTPLYVEGYGYAIAADRGGAIKGNKIDLCYDTYEEAVQFGRKNVKVYILR